ncbi:MAG: 4-hydroxy-tetrahydrodipicolinate reductase [Alphaproteobacteria bacterium CG11_big_fil_rev_8_21_14_0_20_44_7]|nr:MAG: 4-hydroxy-tetrahydrodipicolinate reductase [Alphaproteobacteria bacterium CG11_big_fil_rev_8_21_14_0_20_44_7]
MKIGILGNTGRMGQTLMAEIAAMEDVVLSGGADKDDDIEALIEASDALIDFTAPLATLSFAEMNKKYNRTHIIGTTGFNDEEFARLKSYATNTRIFWSPNMSIGVNLLNSLIEKAASILGDEYDIEIVEMHHRHKVDAPSGTALAMGEAAARGRRIELKNKQVLSREGITGARAKGDIGFATLRGGSVIGDHTAIFAGDSDRIELTHKSSSRAIYAQGAIRAAIWANTQPNGFYTMQDMLKL